MFSIRLLVVAAPLAITAASAANNNWPQFRGPRAAGVAEKAAPVTWNVTTGENVRWQTPIPGLAHASPIIWNDQIYLTTAVKPGSKPDLKIGLYGSGDSYKEKEPHQWRLLCLDKKSGTLLWDKLCLEAIPRQERHTKATHCNSTPATDGKHIVAMFGSEGVFCFDMNGRELWRKDLGKLHVGPSNAQTLEWGFASSPVLHDGKVILQCDTLSEKFLAALDADDGHELWRTPRDDAASWATPLIATTKDLSQIVLSGWHHSGGYDLASGRELWRLIEGGDIPIASPVQAGDLAILTSGHGKHRPMRAIRLDASGNITPPEMGDTNQSVVWCHPRKGNYIQTPIVRGDLLWGCLDNGVITCFDVRTGKVHYEERLGSGNQGFTASPVIANDRLYFTSEEGHVFVLPTVPAFSIVATNQLGGMCLSTPAISDQAIFFRTTEKLIAIAAKKSKDRAPFEIQN